MQKQKFYKEIVDIIKHYKSSKQKFSVIKNKLAKKCGMDYTPTDIEIYLSVDNKDAGKIKDFLLTKPTRTISGVSVCALMAMPVACRHGKCTFCPGGPGSVFGNVPQSYTGKEPSTRRSIRNDFDPYLIVMNRIEQYVVTGHVPEKMEIIIQGGTFPSYPKSYQEEFVKFIFKAMNDFSRLFYKNNKLDFIKFKKFFELPGDIYNNNRKIRLHNKLLNIKNKHKTYLEKEQLKNETAKIRCIGLTIETKPDWGKLSHGNEMLKLGCTRIEIGIQTIYDKVLKLTNRGHTIKDSIESIRILKDLGFKLNFHMMPGLPTVTRQKDLKSLNEIFKNSNFMPDMLKIYPCMVMKGTPLYDDYKKGKFVPLTTKQAAELIAEFKKNIPYFTRLMRVQRDIPTNITQAGVDKTNLRQYVEKITKEKNIICKCIRCREPRLGKLPNNIKYFIHKYDSSNGTDFFISAEDFNRKTIYGFVRLRFPSSVLRKEITKNSALIRELHVYGPAASIGAKGSIQHKGIGKKLMKIAEQISAKNKKNKIIVISGIGVKEYFKMIGYHKEGVYMVKQT